jgi:hypothetical protein
MRHAAAGAALQVLPNHLALAVGELQIDKLIEFLANFLAVH